MTDTLDLGIITPVLTRRPGAHAAWELDAGIDEVRQIAVTAERLGYEYLSCCEHVAVPRERPDVRDVRPGETYWDPLPTFGYLAAHTTRIHLTTLVVVIPHHHPLEIAKRYGTLDRICGGRLVLGLGVGYREPEFDLLGTPFDRRGVIADDAIRALRASFGTVEPSYDGEIFRFDGFVVDPCGVQREVPIWIGGMSRRSLRRAVELGDAWAPFAVTPEQIVEWVDAVKRTDAWEQRARPLVLALTPAAPVDPLGARDATAAVVRTLHDAGATKLSLRFRHDSLAHYLEQMEAMLDIVRDL
jgi:probable F420-dependent oxidoreductase